MCLQLGFRDRESKRYLMTMFMLQCYESVIDWLLVGNRALSLS